MDFDLGIWYSNIEKASGALNERRVTWKKQGLAPL